MYTIYTSGVLFHFPTTYYQPKSLNDFALQLTDAINIRSRRHRSSRHVSDKEHDSFANFRPPVPLQRLHVRPDRVRRLRAPEPTDLVQNTPVLLEESGIDTNIGERQHKRQSTITNRLKEGQKNYV